MQRRTRQLLAGGAALAIALSLPAIAQDRPESILPPGFGDPTPATPAPTPTPTPSPAAPTPITGPSEGAGVEVVDTLSPAEALEVAEPVPQVEFPAFSRRDPGLAGTLDPVALRLGALPWGQASGQSLGILMRRMDTPLASRWAHIALRNALLAQAPAPFGVNPIDWAAERTWLLLRMGEADAARLLVAAVDSDRYTGNMSQVALQSALASSDPSAMCPLETSLSKVEPRVAPLVTAICASLSGEAERAAADIEATRRRGRLGGIDLTLADKVVGAGAATARAVTIEWEPVDRLNAWRYGLSTATAMMPPERLMTSASLQTQAWFARAPMFSATQRLPAARIAAALGVFSSEALIDLYAAHYDATDPDALGQSDGWQLRLAFIGKDQDARLAAMRRLWGKAKSPFDRVAANVLLARPARRIVPSADLEADAPELVAALLAGGFDREAGRWARVVGEFDDPANDKVWAMLALGAPDVADLGISASRIEDFADNDVSKGKQRTALLVAGLAGLGRIDSRTAGRLSATYKLGLGAQTSWTRLIDGAMQRRQAGTATVLAASGLQGRQFDEVGALYLFHSVNAMRGTGQDYLARMIAAEALART
ncbi:MAG: hypothetical protein H0W65_06025 [Sphingomonas sp.]|uniref:hypothetical protein n=1 Tax=Sphingomonas sp. TaxID=28214 RepID=UPI00179ADF23|nr:hypothetical protein [Sphingomonas sp.]MBA3667262.1 hypothetical protein [Sphingomonas sp.]